MYREIAVMKKLDHPNVVKLYKVHETDTVLYLVLEVRPRAPLPAFVTPPGRTATP